MLKRVSWRQIAIGFFLCACALCASAFFYWKRFHPVFLERGQRISAYMSKLNAEGKNRCLQADEKTKLNEPQKHTCYKVSVGHMVGSVLAEGLDYQTFLKNRATLARRLATRSTRLTIPKITHHIWLTDPNTPREVSEDDMRSTLKTLQALPSSAGWRHILWVNKQGLIPKTIDALMKLDLPSGVDIEVKL